MPGAHSRPEFLASPDWLAENIGRPEVRVLDVRWRPDGSGRLAFLAGHVPGAAYLDWRTTLAVPGVDDVGVTLAPPDLVAEALAGLGVGNGSTVVVYDDTASLYAARAWWSLRACGLDSVRILDGGFGQWQASGRPVSHAAPMIAPTHFTARATPRLRLTTADVRALLGSADAQVVDTRTQVEYRGLQGAGRRLGRVPGALNLPAGSLTEPGSQRFVDGGGLRALIAAAGIARGRRTVCYDAAGIGASKAAFALALMGFDDVAVYDGGWVEWTSRHDLPVEAEVVALR